MILSQHRVLFRVYPEGLFAQDLQLWPWYYVNHTAYPYWYCLLQAENIKGIWDYEKNNGQNKIHRATIWKTTSQALFILYNSRPFCLWKRFRSTHLCITSLTPSQRQSQTFCLGFCNYLLNTLTCRLACLLVPGFVFNTIHFLVTMRELFLSQNVYWAFVPLAIFSSGFWLTFGMEFPQLRHGRVNARSCFHCLWSVHSVFQCADFLSLGLCWNGTLGGLFLLLVSSWWNAPLYLNFILNAS